DRKSSAASDWVCRIIRAGAREIQSPYSYCIAPDSPLSRLYHKLQKNWHYPIRMFIHLSGPGHDFACDRNQIRYRAPTTRCVSLGLQTCQTAMGNGTKMPFFTKCTSAPLRTATATATATFGA